MTTLRYVIPEEQIRILPSGIDKQGALNLLIDAVSENPVVTDREAFRQAVFEREAVMSTGIGNGVGMPHVRISEVTAITLGVGISREGVEFQSLDQKPVHVMVLFATPLGSERIYLNLLAEVMRILRDQTTFASLLNHTTPEQIHAIFCK